VNDEDRSAALFLPQIDDLPGHLLAFDEFTPREERSAADLNTGPTSPGFIRATLRRSAWFLCVAAVVGMLAGFAVLKKFPPAYQASTTVLLASNLPGPSGEAVQDDAAIVLSRTVAGDALRTLGLTQSPESLTGAYSVAVITNRVFAITVKASSYQAAVREANALATAFLRFQAQQLESQAQLVVNSLQQQITAAQQRVDSIGTRIKAVSAQPPSAKQRAQLRSLLADRSQAVTALNQTKQANLGSEASTKTETAALVKGSKVLDPAVPLPQHAKKYLLVHVGGGLIAGLALGLSIVIVRALVSDRLRRRDDVARALGAPVKLSVGKVRRSRLWPGRRGVAAAESAEIQRIVTHLGSAVPTGSPGIATLAVVPVDETQVAALSLVSLAVSTAQEGFKVVMADLCPGSPAARLLGAADPGVQSVEADGTRIVVVIPDPDDVTPVGPLHRRSGRAAAKEPLAVACASADLLLTLATLDPSFGGDHLGGWARGAVVVVTAGQSSAERIHGVGEMIRLSGMELISAVLVGADKTDESVGVTAPSSPPVRPDGVSVHNP
jgi:capsular polysaccharide biosynthesis protein